MGEAPTTATILVVEDDLFVRELAEQILVSQGYRVLVAANADDALRLSEEHEGVIDLLFTDMILPGFNGAELYRRITAMRPGIRSLFTSGYPAEGIVEHGLLSADLPVLPKPFTGKELAERVRQVLEEPPPEAPPGGPQDGTPPAGEL